MNNINDNQLKTHHFYNKAIKISIENKFNNDTALFYKNYAYFCKRIENQVMYEQLIKRAYVEYDKWGANAILSFIENKNKELNFVSLLKQDYTKSLKGKDILDVISIERFLEVTNNVIHLNDLIIKLIKIIFESSSAKSVKFLQIKNKKVYLFAQGEFDSEVKIIEPVLLRSSELLPLELIEEVIDIQSKIIVDDAVNDKKLKNVNYVKRNDIKSIVCIPLKYQGIISGVIYLENNSITNVFNEQKVKLLEMLSSQIAVALENAFLFNSLEKSEKKHRELVENIQDGVFIIQDDVFKFVNDALVEIGGYNQEEVIGMDFDKYISKEFLDFVKEKKKLRLLGEQPENEYEISIINKEGEKIPVIISASLIMFEGKPAIQGILKDISKRKKMEQELKMHKEKLEELVKIRTFEIKNILNNANQGFIYFGKDLKINRNFNKKSEEIFNFSLEGKTILELLEYENKNEDKDLFKEVIEKFFDTEKIIKKEMLISLLPLQLEINSKIVNVEYKIITNLEEIKIMVILSDVTEKIELNRIIQKDRMQVKMLISIINNKKDFVERTKMYLEFCTNGLKELFFDNENKLKKLNEFWRKIHTFKGIFAQWNMQSTTKNIHRFEEKRENLYNIYLKNGNNKLLDHLKIISLEKMLDHDMDIVKSNIGDFIFQEEYVYKFTDNESRLLDKILKIEVLDKDIQDIKNLLKLKKLTNIKEVLKKYKHYVNDLAEKNNKSIDEFEIFGDDIFIKEKDYLEFFDSFINIFRNIVDHGLKSKNKNKNDNKNSIKIRIKDNKNSIIFIEIFDNGSGIDLEKLKMKLVEKSVVSKEKIENLKKEEILEYLFRDQISLKKNVTSLSGRGVGLSKVKEEVLKRGGTIKVETQKDKFTRFKIEIPKIT